MKSEGQIQGREDRAVYGGGADGWPNSVNRIKSAVAIMIPSPISFI